MKNESLANESQREWLTLTQMVKQIAEQIAEQIVEQIVLLTLVAVTLASCDIEFQKNERFLERSFDDHASSDPHGDKPSE